MAKNAQYYVTEQEISKLFSLTPLPMSFITPFTRDYAALKRDSNQTANEVSGIDVRVSSLEGRMTNVETDIGSLNSSVAGLNASVADLDGRLDIVEVDLPQLRLDFDAHAASQVAHGSTGNIVGTGDYCTAVLGGVVLLASAIADKAAFTASITSTPNAAGAAYVQADAATWVAMLNEIKADLNALINDHIALITFVNSLKNTQVTAKQRAS